MRHSIDDLGMALIGVLITLALLMSLAVALAVSVNSDTQLRGAFGSTVTGFYAAESGLNKGMAEYRNIFLSYNVPSGDDFAEKSFGISDREVVYQLQPASWMTTDCQAGQQPPCPRSVTIPAGQVFAGLNELQYNYTVKSKAMNANGDVEASVGAEFIVGYIPLFQFAAFYKDDLEILPGPNMVLNGRVHTNGNLHLGSGATLSIADNPAKGVYTVQVSAGGGIYRGRKDENLCQGTVNVDKLEDVVSPFGDLDPKALPCNGTSTRLVPLSELALWKGSMVSGIGSIAIPEPDIIKPPASLSGGGTADPGVYWEKADLRIVLQLNVSDQLPGGAVLPHAIEVVNPSGMRDPVLTAQLHAFMSDAAWNAGSIPGRGPSTYPGTMPIFYTDVPFASGSGCANGQPTCNNHLSASYVPAIPAPTSPNPRPTTDPASAYREIMGSALGNFDLDYRRGGFYNHREKKWMLLLNINVRDLILWNSQNGEPFFATADNTEGGIVIFATVAGPDSGIANNNYGVRVFGSADIPLPGGIDVSTDPTGVTVASDQAMYVLGDFNRGIVNGGTQPRQPASLIGDSVNVLSQRYWRGAATCNTRYCRDGQSVRSLSDTSRDAQNTWINAAFLGGVDKTPSGYAGNYNGGLENYPRFHEDWGGYALTYQGSFVSLGTPEHVNGAWCGTGGSLTSGCNIYNPPTRLWNFDPGFTNAANLPPLTPRFVYVQQVLFTEDFK